LADLAEEQQAAALEQAQPVQFGRSQHSAVQGSARYRNSLDALV
jgi:hypothetical protein